MLPTVQCLGPEDASPYVARGLRRCAKVKALERRCLSQSSVSGTGWSDVGCRRGAWAPGNAERRSPRAPGRNAACRHLDFSWRNPCWTSDFRKRKMIHLQAHLFIYLFMPLNSWRFVMAGTGCADRWAAGWRDGWMRKGGGGGPRCPGGHCRLPHAGLCVRTF